MAKKQENLSGFKKFQALTQTKGYKTFMGYVYGIGASVVMIGAYFKLTHIPGADFMLGLGLGISRSRTAKCLATRSLSTGIGIPTPNANDAPYPTNEQPRTNSGRIFFKSPVKASVPAPSAGTSFSVRRQVGQCCVPSENTWPRAPASQTTEPTPIVSYSGSFSNGESWQAEQ